MLERVTDERLDVLVQQRTHDEEWYLTELQTFYLLRELQEWRSGKRKRWQDEVCCTISADPSGLDAALADAAQRIAALPKAKKLKKWLRQLDTMSATLEPPSRTWGSLCWTVTFGIGDRILHFDGATPQEAVADAYVGWQAHTA